MTWLKSPVFAVMVAVVLTGGVVGGIAVAQTSSGVIGACVNDTNGNVRVVKSPGDCKNHESFVTLNRQGEPGPAGPMGPAASNLWAVVEHNGTLVQQSGAESSEALVPGIYLVVFDRDVTNCAYLATIGVGSEGGGIQRGEVSVADGSGRADAVRVFTSTSLGELAPRAFHMAVLC